MRERRRFISGLAALAAATTLGRARQAFAAPRAELKVELARPAVAAGQEVMVDVTVTTYDGSDPMPPSFAAVDGLHLQAVRNRFSSSSSFSFGTGAATTRRASETFRYIAWADKPGEYPISPNIKTRDGVVEALDVPILKVVAGGQEAAIAGTAGTPGQPQTGSALPDGLDAGAPFVVSKLGQEEIWLGQSFHYRAETWAPLQRGSRDYVFSIDNQSDLPAAVKTSLPAAKARRERVQNIPYKVEEIMNVLITPQRAGTLQVPGLAGSAQLVERVFFDLRGLAQPVKVQGEDREIVVKPLPAQGQPANFRPFNVGRLQIDARVDRTKVPAGEGFTLTVTIAGQGNLSLIEPDAWPELPAHVRRYDPEVSDPQRSFKQERLWGKRTWTFLVIPDGGGTFTIPEHTLHYFDPDTGRYALAKSKPIEISVEGAAAAPKPDAAASTGAKKAPKATTSTDDEDAPLAPIRGGEGLARSGTEAGAPLLTPGRWSWLAAGVPMAFAATFVGERLWNRFGPDEQARSRAARQQARAGALAEAQTRIESGEGFWSTLGELLQRSAVEVLGPDAQGLTRSALAERLAALGVAPGEVEAWRALLDRADAARFGAGDQDASARREAYAEAESIIKDAKWRAR